MRKAEQALCLIQGFRTVRVSGACTVFLNASERVLNSGSERARWSPWRVTNIDLAPKTGTVELKMGSAYHRVGLAQTEALTWTSRLQWGVKRTRNVAFFRLHESPFLRKTAVIRRRLVLV